MAVEAVTIQNDEGYSTLTIDQYEKLQRRILDDATKIMTEFKTVPLDMMKAFQCIRYDIRREERLGAIMRHVVKNGVGFEKIENKHMYLTRNVNYQTGGCHYLPRAENNQLFLFYLTYCNSIKEYQVKNKDEVVMMNFLLKDRRGCKVIVLPPDIKKANKIMADNESNRQLIIASEQREEEDIKARDKTKKKKTEAVAPAINGYESFYIVKNLEFAKKLKLDGLDGRFVFDYKEKFKDLQWSLQLKDIPRLGHAKIEMIKQIKKMEK